MKLYSQGKRRKSITINLSKEDVHEMALAKYRKIDTHPVRENRKRGHKYGKFKI